MSLQLTQVRAFVAVIDAGGFQEAARRLDCAQPTVTQLVRKLETGLGVQLIVRNRRGAIATPAGKAFLPHARRLLHAEARALASVDQHSLVIGASGNIGTYLMPSVLKKFGSARSDIRAELTIGPNPEIAVRIETGDVDLAVMEWWDDRPGLRAELWRRERLVVIVPPDHAWARKKSIRKDLLFDTELIGGESGSGTGRLLRRVFGARADGIRVAMNLGSTAAVKEAVKAGLGISLVLESAVQDEVRSGILRAIPVAGEPLEKELFIVTPEDVPPTAPSARFRDFVRRELTLV